MVVIIFPDWYVEAEEELDNAIHKIVSNNFIDYSFVDDSNGIKEGKSLILSRLVRIYENVNVEQREKQQEFFRKLKPKKKK